MAQNVQIETTPAFVKNVYARMTGNLPLVQKRLGRPLTLSEKILLTHLDHVERQELVAGSSILSLRPDRVCMQDVTAQMALLQFMQSNRGESAVPTTVHCDHLIRGHSGAQADLDEAKKAHKEVYDFLRSSCQKYGIGFWEPGSGIIHQVFLENYAFPGGLIIGTDSHTPNGGGLTMLAIGVGGADAAEVMSGLPWEVLYPKRIGVHLKGKLNGWTAPKDVILKVCEILTTKGGTNAILEYFGDGTHEISATGKATITNMGAELGATTSVFPYDKRSSLYLKATGREEIARLAEKNLELLESDSEMFKAPEKYFDRVIEIDLNKLEPYVVGPHSPDVARPVSKLALEAKEKGYPDSLSSCLIGSCTNSSYEDLSRVIDVALQARDRGIRAKAPLLITPGSEMIYRTIEREGYLKILEDVGARVLANACGPCIGQWKRDDHKKGEPNSILTSYNRNFPRRNDGDPATLAFIGSPELVMAISLSGKLTFNPLQDKLTDVKGNEFLLKAPKVADEVPKKGFSPEKGAYTAPPPPAKRTSIKVVTSPESERLQLLKQFPAWDGKDFVRCPLLLKAKGKCTTDHISPAGPWLQYRGHLDKISDNMFLGAINAYTDEAGKGLNLLTLEKGKTFAEIARSYKERGLRWIVVGDENYGEGSSREHAAMSPRYLGAAAVIVKSFARIHETNLKKQGVLPLIFVKPSDYDKVAETDRISILGLRNLAPHKRILGRIHHEGGTEEEITLEHSMTATQIEWFKAGSAINTIFGQGRQGPGEARESDLDLKHC